MDWELLAGLTETQREQVLASARRRSFGHNEVVCHAGDPADTLHLVLDGHVAVTAALPTGDAALLSVVGPGGHFGELALLREDGRRTATVTALEGATTLVVDRAVFHRLRSEGRELDQCLSRLLADRVDALSQRLLEGLYLGLDRRVGRRLLDLTATYAGESAEPVRIPLTQTQVAHLAGGSRASVNQVLRRWEDEGVVAIGRGRIDVLDPATLGRRAGL